MSLQDGLVGKVKCYQHSFSLEGDIWYVLQFDWLTVTIWQRSFFSHNQALSASQDFLCAFCECLYSTICPQMNASRSYSWKPTLANIIGAPCWGAVKERWEKETVPSLILEALFALTRFRMWAQQRTERVCGLLYFHLLQPDAMMAAPSWSKALLIVLLLKIKSYLNTFKYILVNYADIMRLVFM